MIRASDTACHAWRVTEKYTMRLPAWTEKISIWFAAIFRDVERSPNTAAVANVLPEALPVKKSAQ